MKNPRLVYLALGAAAALALPSWSGCCDDPTDPAPVYRIKSIQAEFPYPLTWVEGSGRVFVRSQSLEIKYDTPDGTHWEVEFRRLADD